MNECPVLDLTGINGRHHLGFLAALGVLRIAIPVDPGARLSWNPQQLTARLHTEMFADVDALTARLVAVFNGQDNLRYPYRNYPRKKKKELTTSAASARSAQDWLDDKGRVALAAWRQGTIEDPDGLGAWLSGVATDLARSPDKKDGVERVAEGCYPTTSRQESITAYLSKTVDTIEKDPARFLGEALTSWRRCTDGAKSMVLDYATSFGSTLGETTWVPGGIWLAQMSIPLIRTTTTATGWDTISTGWRLGRDTKDRTVREMRWPLWRPPLDMEQVLTLWESPVLHDADLDDKRAKRDIDRLEVLGVFDVERAVLTNAQQMHYLRSIR